jgi:4-deoxy-L-threo-5-hexosulose-uronate ketol-isomerase
MFMTKHEFRYASHPKDALQYGSEELKRHFLIENLFSDDEIHFTYSMYDRYIVGGAKPVKKDLVLETLPYLKSDNFLDRREMGIVNVGLKGIVVVDGISYELDKKEALYIAKGAKEVIFKAGGAPLYYINSAPAHKSFSTKKIGRKDAEIMELGNSKYCNRRIINKLIVNSVVETCQLQMGLTELLEGNVWNTMPAHTHERRMEAYFYFDLEEGQAICHFMGQPDNTRHIFMKNHQAVLSPEWSIHSGAGTSNYSFVWGMAGENLDYGDMDVCAPDEMR